MNQELPPMQVRRLHNYLHCPRLFYLHFVSLGPEDSKQIVRIETLGQPYIGRSRVTII